MSFKTPNVIVDLPVTREIQTLLQSQTNLVDFADMPNLTDDQKESISGIYTYGHPAVDEKLLREFANLKIVSNCGVGVDHIVLEDCEARNVAVCNTPNVLNGATADLAFALLLATSRRLSEGISLARDPNFTHFDPGKLIATEVHSTTLGIVGMGRIGYQIARRAQGFDMKVLYSKRSPHPDAEKVNASHVGLDELLQRSDHVILICPLTAETTGLIGARELHMMKPTATLINLARGPVVDTDALTNALNENQIYAAGLDVTDPEPLPRDHPLLSMPNATILPHLGSATQQTRSAMAQLSVENLMRGLKGEEILNRVV